MPCSRSRCHPSHVWTLHLVALATGLLTLLDIAEAWDYSSNGEDWSGLGVCGGQIGYRRQSPIDLPAGAKEDLRGTVFMKYPHIGQSVTLYNNGYSIAMTLPETYKAGFGIAGNTSVLTEDGADVYRLWQVNFHSPSEHTLAGERMPLEMQLMHQRLTGPPKIAVISVFFQATTVDTNSWLESLLDNGLPSGAWDEVEVNDRSDPHIQGGPPQEHDIGLGNLLASSSFYAYYGSLTVPPCETEAQYLVRQSPVTASREQIASFQSVLESTCPPKGNYRDIPSFTSASSFVTMLPSEDVLTGAHSGPTSAFQAAAGSDDLQSSSLDRVRQDPDLKVLRATDSDALREAKTAYSKARLELGAADVAQAQAKSSLADALQKSGGSMDDMEVKRALAAVVHAKAQVLAGQSAFEKAAQYVDALSVSGGDKADVSEALEQAQRMKLNYRPEISLPRGHAANPFVDGVVASETSGASSLQGVKLAPSLRKADGPPGQSPVAELAPVELGASSADTAGTVHSDGVSAMEVQSFTNGVREAIAASRNISIDMVEAREVREVMVALPVRAGNGTDAVEHALLGVNAAHTEMSLKKHALPQRHKLSKRWPQRAALLRGGASQS